MVGPYISEQPRGNTQRTVRSSSKVVRVPDDRCPWSPRRLDGRIRPVIARSRFALATSLHLALLAHVLLGGQEPKERSVGSVQIKSDLPPPNSVESGTRILSIDSFPTEIAVPERPVDQEFISLSGIEFVQIPAGELLMVSNKSSVQPQNSETTIRIISKFLLGRYEVTQSEWESVMGRNPSHFSGCGRCPVENVTWRAVQRFINRLNKQKSSEGYRFRLPTEAEWEYAARAGISGNWYASDLDLIAWHGDNSESRTHPVGQKVPNGFGLFDMLGNVWELVQDRFDKYPSGAEVGPNGPESGHEVAVRGGSWSGPRWQSRLSNRIGVFRNWNAINMGFRLAATAQ